MSGREFSPMIMQHPDSSKVKCKDCKFRDKTILMFNEKVIPVGITKCRCEKYLGTPHDMGKPHEVLFMNGECQYYEKGD